MRPRRGAHYVDLMGQLSNPAEPLESAPDKGGFGLSPIQVDDLEGPETALQVAKIGRSGRKGTAFNPPCPAKAHRGRDR